MLVWECFGATEQCFKHICLQTNKEKTLLQLLENIWEKILKLHIIFSKLSKKKKLITGSILFHYKIPVLQLSLDSELPPKPQYIFNGNQLTAMWDFKNKKATTDTQQKKGKFEWKRLIWNMANFITLFQLLGSNCTEILAFSSLYSKNSSILWSFNTFQIPWLSLWLAQKMKDEKATSVLRQLVIKAKTVQ